MITVQKTRSGESTVCVDSVYLYSRYGPKRQISRFLEEQDIAADGVVIVVSDGFGLLEAELYATAPSVQVVSIVLSRDVHELSPREYQHPTWIFGSPVDLSVFLGRHLNEQKIHATSIIVWEPSARVFADRFRDVRDSMDTSLRRTAHSRLTSRYYGRRWIQNLLRNIASTPAERRVSELPITKKPVVLIIPGPGVGTCLPTVQRYRGGITLVCVSSSLTILDSHRLVPDIVVHTDPGFYASLLFPPSISPRESVLCMPLTARRPGTRYTYWFPFSNGLEVETDALARIGISVSRIPEAGTVTATALRIADSIRLGPLFVCGLDMCLHDIRVHARGHGFDSYLLAQTQRLRPIEQQYFQRIVDTTRDAAGYRYAPNLNVYAAWIKDFVKNRSAMYRVNASPVDLGMMDISSETFESMLREKSDELREILPYSSGLVSQSFPGGPQQAMEIRERWNRMRGIPHTDSDLARELHELLVNQDVP